MPSMTFHQILQPKPCGLPYVCEVGPQGRSAEEEARMCGGGGVEEAEEDSSAPPGPRLNPAALGPPRAAPGALPSQPVSLFSRGVSGSRSAPGEALGVCERGCQGSSGRSSRPVSILGPLAGPLPAPEQPCGQAGACRGVWAPTRRSRWWAWTPLPFFLLIIFLVILIGG